jgi:O-antigen/teichoic acid export membrane protein
LSYQFGFLVTQLGEQPFTSAWLPQRFSHAKDAPAERNRLNALGALAFAIVLNTVAVGVAVSARPLVHLMATPAYAGAATTVPVLAMAYVVACLTGGWKFGIDYSLETRYFTYATWISVVVMLLAYALLIPPFGAMGAALATLIGFVARAIPTVFWAQRLFPLHYEWRRTAVLCLAALSTALLPAMIPAVGLGRMITISTAALVMYAAAVWWLVLGTAHRATLLDFVGMQWKRRRA